jgi:hypothetical protein
MPNAELLRSHRAEIGQPHSNFYGTSSSLLSPVRGGLAVALSDFEERGGGTSLRGIVRHQSRDHGRR